MTAETYTSSAFLSPTSEGPDPTWLHLHVVAFLGDKMLLLWRTNTNTSNIQEPTRRPPLRPLRPIRPGWELPGRLFQFSDTSSVDTGHGTTFRKHLAFQMLWEANIPSQGYCTVHGVRVEKGVVGAGTSADPEGMLRVTAVVELDEEKKAEILAKVAARRGYELVDKAKVEHMRSGPFATDEVMFVLSRAWNMHKKAKERRFEALWEEMIDEGPNEGVAKC